MTIAYLFVGLLSAAVAIFALQNGQPASLHFLAWSLEGVPLASAILIALSAGLLLAGIPLSIEQLRWRSRARSLATRVSLLESALGERDVPALAQRPARIAREA